MSIYLVEALHYLLGVQMTMELSWWALKELLDCQQEDLRCFHTEHSKNFRPKHYLSFLVDMQGSPHWDFQYY